MSQNSILTLYGVFESYFGDFDENSENENDFIAKVVKEYMVVLQKSGSVIPPRMKLAVAEELHEQVRTMLRKKIYGCLSIQEYFEKNPAARAKGKSQPTTSEPFERANPPRFRLKNKHR